MVWPLTGALWLLMVFQAVLAARSKGSRRCRSWNRVHRREIVETATPKSFATAFWVSPACRRTIALSQSMVFSRGIPLFKSAAKLGVVSERTKACFYSWCLLNIIHAKHSRHACHA